MCSASMTEKNSTAEESMASGRRYRAGGSRAARPRRASVLGLVLAEDVAHGPAGLAERAAVLEGLADEGQEVVGPPRRLAQLLEPLLDEPAVAVALEGLEARHLRILLGLVHLERVRDLDVLGHVLVDAADVVLAEPVALAVAPGRLLDLVLHEGDGLDGAAELVDPVDELLGPGLDLR